MTERDPGTHGFSIITPYLALFSQILLPDTNLSVHKRHKGSTSFITPLWEKKKSLCLVHKDSPIMSSSFVHGGKVVPAASNLLSVFFTDTN